MDPESHFHKSGFGARIYGYKKENGLGLLENSEKGYAIGYLGKCITN